MNVIIWKPLTEIRKREGSFYEKWHNGKQTFVRSGSAASDVDLATAIEHRPDWAGTDHFQLTRPINKPFQIESTCKIPAFLRRFFFVNYKSGCAFINVLSDFA